MLLYTKIQHTTPIQPTHQDPFGLGSCLHRAVPQAKKNCNPKGFTLFELIAVILLLAIFAAAVRGPVVSILNRITTRNAIEQVKTIDRLMRLEARRSGKVVQLHIDPLEGTLTRTTSTNEQTPIGQSIQLAKNIRIEQIRIAPAQDDFDELNAIINCSPHGATTSYAMQIQTPSQTTWLLFAGLTGQSYELESEEDLVYVFDELSRPWSELN